ncbi:MAG: MFS transporter [Planctomycetaceae bacterium]|nr:MFS transporter [Planctomycetaceae bacterium]
MEQQGEQPLAQPAPHLDAVVDSPLRLPDRSFQGMAVTQFLGAFNDNLFKQLILLICIDAAQRMGSSDVYQPVAQALFAVPFILFSGFAGFLSDRLSKRRIIVLCKLAEIGVMLAGLAVFLFARSSLDPSLALLLCVLTLMGTQSAFFGPAKYGVLPELLPDRDLPAANGIIQMTTFLAIIFGTAAAGYGKDLLEDRLWVISVGCLIIAIAGTLTSLLVRQTPPAQPALRFEWSSLAVNRDTWQMLVGDRTLFGVLLISSLFWFLGGVLLQTVNAFGKNQLEIGDSRTSILSASIGFGIAAGCALAGKISRSRIRFGLVTVGSWGLVFGLCCLAGLGLGVFESRHVEWLAWFVLIELGLSAGLFVVPLQVFMQTRPPAEQKGRMIGAMNLINWIAILAASGFYALCAVLLNPVSWTFGVLAVLLLPVAIFYRPARQNKSS